MPVQPNFLERTAFYTLNQAPAVMLDMAGAMSYQTMSTAVRLGIFDALAERPQSAGELATQLGAQERGVDMLLQALAATGYVVARNGHYTNSAMTSKWLVDNEAFNGRAIMAFWDDALATLWPGADGVIRSGQRPIDIYEWIESDPDRNRSFQETLVVTALSSGPAAVKKLDLPPSATRLLDVGGGHGLFAILACREYPNLKATILDRPAALEVAARYVADYDMADRVELVAGDLWEVDWGKEYDAILLFNLIHHFDMATNAQLLRKAAVALRHGGKVAILDQVAGKVSGSATNALIRLVALQYYVFADGRVFTHAELEQLLSHTGFGDIRTISMAQLPGNSLVTAVKT